MCFPSRVSAVVLAMAIAIPIVAADNNPRPTAGDKESSTTLLQQAADLRRKLQLEDAVAIAEQAISAVQPGDDARQAREVLDELKLLQTRLRRVNELRESLEFAEAQRLATRILAQQIAAYGRQDKLVVECRNWIAAIRREKNKQEQLWEAVIF